MPNSNSHQTLRRIIHLAPWIVPLWQSPLLAAAALVAESGNPPRRAFLSVLASGAAVIPTFVIAAETYCDRSSSKERLSDTRDQIDMAVQASSVQAFSSALELVNDPLLDPISLRSVLCSTRDATFVTESIESMRTILGKTNGGALATEDAMAVMKYGTTARSTIDSMLALQ